jgi:hypothetical protein
MWDVDVPAGSRVPDAPRPERLGARGAGKEEEQESDENECEKESGGEMELPLKYPWHGDLLREGGLDLRGV